MNDQSPRYLSTDERKRAIAVAARALIVEKGIDALRTREVAARVGINIATLHYHVPSKDALLHLVVDSMIAQFIEQGMNNPREGLDPLECLKLEIAEYKDTMLNNPDLLQLMDDMGKRARVDEQLEIRMREMKKRWHRSFVDVLVDGKSSGVFRSDLDPVAAAHMITGALIAFQYKPKHLLPLFDSVASEIVKSVSAR